ncbi:hypothetical protein L1787_06000 [Acuticoccus sp. M5D2P5]|uniref:hypothetical protein n=1 Tax=Acuticoccus kalidii TaxID=2910977 RepID=UPI001F44589F|nr:hypothetical protein [Acuticoccus kalidii]MCF3932966.1 hypothetical protein [Acuticoccus kalidii]
MTDLDRRTCPICKSAYTISYHLEFSDRWVIDCDHCGPFEITNASLAIVARLPEAVRHEWLERAREEVSSDHPVPMVSLYRLDRIMLG